MSAVKKAESTEEPVCPVCGEVLGNNDHLSLRGKHYIAHELFAEPYEDVVKRATVDDESGDPDTDMILLRKFLVIESITEDGKALDAAAFAKMPYPVYAKLDSLARRKHWGEIETDEEIAARRKSEAKSGVPSR